MATAGRYDNSMVDEYDNGDGPDSSGEQLDLQYYLRILRKHKWPITLFTAIITGLAAYYAYNATPIYSGTATVLIEQQKTVSVSVDELFNTDSDSQDYYQTQFELLRSRALADRVITALNLWEHPELSPFAGAQEGDAAAQVADENTGLLSTVTGFFDGLTGSDSADDNSGVISLDPQQPVAGVTADNAGTLAAPAGQLNADLLTNVGTTGAPADMDETLRLSIIGRYLGRLSISPVRKTKLVKISYESTNPVMAARVANAVGEQYIEAYLDTKYQQTEVAQGWLNERLAVLKGTLDESNQRLIDFKQANGLVDVDGSVGRLNEQELRILTEERARINSQLSDAADIFRDTQALAATPELLETIPAVQADPLVQRVKIDEGQAQRQLDELLNRYGERHPRVVDAKSQLGSLRASLDGHIARVVGTIEKDYQLLRQRLATINSRLDAGRQDIQVIGNKKFELDALQREVDTNQSLYDTFFSRISEARSTDGLTTANASISDYAAVPVGPIKPKKQLIIALAALASLVLSMLMAFLYEQMDDTVKSTADIEKRVGMRLLGILPLIKSGFLRRTRTLPLNPLEVTDNRGTFTEAVNTARTALCMDEGRNRRQVIMITSSVPGEGKSTASINLAYSLSQLERVLLIDCDLRRPTVAKAAGLDKNSNGLSNLITNTASARECIKRGAIGSNLDVIPSGPIPDQPLELLSSKRFQKILEQLRQHYDRIVLDCAPTQAVSDALVLSKLSDAVIYAVKSHDTSIELVKRGVQRLQQVNAPIAGALITQVDIDKIVAYGGDYYYQGYYDYYGYTDKDEKNAPGKLRLSPEELLDIKSDDSDVELNLDFGPRSRSFSAVRPAAAMAGASAANATFDDPDDFDLTAQLDVHAMNIGAAPQPAGRAARKGRSPVNDDLDII